MDPMVNIQLKFSSHGRLIQLEEPVIRPGTSYVTQIITIPLNVLII